MEETLPLAAFFFISRCDEFPLFQSDLIHLVFLYYK